MKTLLILCAAPLALAAMPAAANDCTARQSETANEKVMSEMLAYSQQGKRIANENDCRPLVQAVDCVDCPEGQRLQQVTIA